MCTPLPTSSGSGFGEKGVRNDTGRTQRGNERLAEHALAAESAERIGVARPVGYAGIEKLLLEGRHKAKARDVGQLLDGTAQKIARAAFPGAAVGVADIAEKEMLDRGTVAEIDPHLDRGVGDDHEITGGAERGVPDRTEGRHHQIAAGPTHTLLQPCRKLAGRESLAAHEPRNVAGRDEDEFFRDHRVTSGVRRSGVG